MRKAWILGIVTLLALVGLSCKKDLKDPDKEVKYTGPVIENKDVVTLYSDSARLLMKVQAPVQQEYENGDGVFPEGVYIEFYDEPGKLTSTLRANYGKLQRNKELYIVQGNVVMHNIAKQEKLESEELYWDRNKDRIYTEKFVTITTPEQVLMGQGLETNQKFWPYRILKPTGTLDIEK